MFIVNRKELLENTVRLQRRNCGYDMYDHYGNKRNPPPSCDCKYGAKGRGESTGCPELRCLVQLLSLMTEEEYLEIMLRNKGNIIL